MLRYIFLMNYFSLKFFFSGWASGSGTGGGGFNPWSLHTKNFKIGSNGFPPWGSGIKDALNISPLNVLWSAKFLICFNFKSASMSLKAGENVVWMSNSLNLDETSHPDSSCLHMAPQLCLVGYRLKEYCRSKSVWLDKRYT